MTNTGVPIHSAVQLESDSPSGNEHAVITAMDLVWTPGFQLNCGYPFKSSTTKGAFSGFSDISIVDDEFPVSEQLARSVNSESEV